MPAAGPNNSYGGQPSGSLNRTVSIPALFLEKHIHTSEYLPHLYTTFTTSLQAEPGIPGASKFKPLDE